MKPKKLDPEIHNIGGLSSLIVSQKSLKRFFFNRNSNKKKS